LRKTLVGQFLPPLVATFSRMFVISTRLMGA